MALHNAELFHAANQADAALRGVHDRMGVLAHAVAHAAPARGVPVSLDDLAAALRDGFGARSAMIALDGEVVGAAAGAADAAPAAAPTTAGSEAAHILARTVAAAGGRLEITLVLPEPATAEHGELLEVAATFAALVARSPAPA